MLCARRTVRGHVDDAAGTNESYSLVVTHSDIEVIKSTRRELDCYFVHTFFNYPSQGDPRLIVLLRDATVGVRRIFLSPLSRPKYDVEDM